jgi:hypothetical protein
MALPAIDLAGVFTPPMPTPPAQTWTPEAIDAASGYPAHVPLEAASPTDEAVGEILSQLGAAVTDLDGLPPDAVAVEVGRRVEGYLRDFARGHGTASVDLAKVHAEARAALSTQHDAQRYARLPEIRQRLVDTVTAAQRSLEAAHLRRRQVTLPTFPDTSGETDPAKAQLVETQRQTDSNLRLLAAMDLPAGTAPAVLLARMQTDPNPHARHRAQTLLEALVPTLRVEAEVAKAQGRAGEAERATAILRGFAEAVEARVPDVVRQAERADQQAWAAMAAAVGRVLVLLAVNDQARTAGLSTPLVPPTLADSVRAAVVEARTAMREAWRPVWTASRAVRAGQRRGGGQ